MSLGEFKIRSASATDEQAWRRVTARSDDAWLGHDWDWNRVVEEGVWGARDESLLVARGKEVVGVVPLHVTERRIGPLARRLLHSNWWGTGGPALVSDLSAAERDAALGAAVGAIHAVAGRVRADKLILRLPPLSTRNLALSPDAPNPLGGFGLEDRSTHANVLRLGGCGERQLWEGMEGRARTAVRKAQRARVGVRRLTQEEAASTYYSLHLATYRRTRAAPLPDRYFATILRSEWSRVFAATYEGSVIAAVNIAVHDGRAFYWTNASLDVAARLGANNLVQWEALRWLRDVGVTAYELGELPSHDAARKDPKLAALALYKRSFGGAAVPYHRAEHVYARRRELLVRMLR